MDGVDLLSEINPATVDRFHPLKQARDWHGLFSDAEVQQILKPGDSEFAETIRLISERCDQQGNRKLIVRDWSHVDFIGFPFNQNPTLQFETRNVLRAGDVPIRSVATVRNPLDQYLSMRRLSILSSVWDEGAVWQGIRAFAEAIQEMPWYRFEDFLDQPDETLRELCGSLKIDFDADYAQRWPSYHKVTGDNSGFSQKAIRRQPRKPIPEEVWKKLAVQRDYFHALDMLGYPVPARFRKSLHFITKGNLQSRETDGRGAMSEGPGDLDQARDYIAEHRYDDAILACEEILRIEPENCDASRLLATALMQTGEHFQARLANGAVLNQDPLDEAALRDQVACLEALGCKFDSIPYRRRLVELSREDRENQFLLANQLVGIGCIGEALTLLRELLKRTNSDDGVAANYLLNLNYSDERSASEIANEHFRIGMRFADRPRELVRSESSDGRVRVGYLSSDFYVHPVGKIMRSVLPHHDRSRFNVTVYYDKGKSDGLTDSIKDTVETFHNVANWTDDQLVQRIDQDEIDILFDLGGYTAGGNRMRVLARRAAPIQVSFLGYPNTSALPTIDYRVTDRLMDPPGLTDHLYGERAVYLDSGSLAWEPYDVVAKVSSDRSGGPRLGAFNNVAKASPSAIRCWAEILRRTPEATLVLKYGDRFGAEIVCDRYRRIFCEYGVMPDRLEFKRASESLNGHLQLMADVDLALDSFPYQGTMTSLECLSVGTPILSLCGGYYAHRATSAMMMRLNLHELIASDQDEYVELATQLLADLTTLRQLRCEVKDRFFSSSLTDPQGLVRELEQSLIRISQSD